MFEVGMLINHVIAKTTCGGELRWLSVAILLDRQQTCLDISDGIASSFSLQRQAFTHLPSR